MILQGVVDANYLFLDILCVGWAGSVHDARVFLYIHSCIHR